MSDAYAVPFTLHTGTAIITNETGSAVQLPYARIWAWELDVTSAATANADKLDVKIQTSFDGATFFDIHTFTQIAGDDVAKTYVAKTRNEAALTEFETGAGAADRALVLKWVRVVATITDDTTPIFTFTVKADPTG